MKIFLILLTILTIGCAEKEKGDVTHESIEGAINSAIMRIHKGCWQDKFSSGDGTNGIKEMKRARSDSTTVGSGKLYYQPAYKKLETNYSIVFGDNVGCIDFKDGVLIFTGNADSSAKLFFDYFLKTYVDNYIRQELKKGE